MTKIAKRRIAIALLSLGSLGLIGWFSDWYRWFGFQFTDPLERDVPVEQWGYEG